MHQRSGDGACRQECNGATRTCRFHWPAMPALTLACRNSRFAIPHRGAWPLHKIGQSIIAVASHSPRTFPYLEGTWADAWVQEAAAGCNKKRPSYCEDMSISCVLLHYPASSGNPQQKQVNVINDDWKS